MKIHSIHVEGFLGARQVDIALVEPITLIAGQNGAGKSSIANAIALALNAELGRVDVKKDAARLVTEGATAACVQIQTDSADFEVHITKAGKITDHAAGRKPHPALPFALDASRFSRLPDAERRTLLFNLLGIETTPEAIAERLARMKCDADKVKAIGPALRAGFVAGEKHARELASQARGKWVAVTGEKAYGDKKAEGWEPPPAAALAGDPAALAENASARANELGEQIAALQQELGAARATREAAQQRAVRIERLRDQAGMVERIKGRLATAEENVASCKAQFAGAGSEDPKAPGSYLLRGLAASVQSLLDEAEKVGVIDSLPSATRASMHLSEYHKLHGDPNAEPADPARLAELRHAMQTAESGAANARRDLAAAEAAGAELAELEKAAKPETPKIEDIETRLADARRRHADWQADVQKYLEAAGAAERRAQQIADAARHHADVQQWSAIADALSPNGIQAEMIAEALDPLNARLAEHAALAQWQPPRIGADMTVTVGGRLYSLLSESERWRADALLAVTIAQLSGLRLVVLDRLDVLDTVGREDALFWLSDVAAAGQIDTAIVLATLKAAPPAQALPTHIASHWIDRGALIATHTNQQALEAA
jgi:energy-coupling factor transporter ATP-binding protein EcfA2